jgi:hypothetical protein
VRLPLIGTRRGFDAFRERLDTRGPAFDDPDQLGFLRVSQRDRPRRPHGDECIAHRLQRLQPLEPVQRRVA